MISLATYFFYSKTAAKLEARGAKKHGIKTRLRKISDGYLLTLKGRGSNQKRS